jgi:acyl-coenzyme A thioesterase PaaI-like protein
MMTPYEMIKANLDTAVPFATHVGVKLLEIGDGVASAELAQRDAVSNHINSMHAGAMFTLGEAASGAAMAGALAPVILNMRPVAAVANIAFKKVAKGTLTA